jgi:hypothetical protein
MNVVNEYLSHLAYEVQVVLDCNAEDAAKIVAAAFSIGQDPVTLAKRLPARDDGKKHNTGELLTALSEAQAKIDAGSYTTCFPAGYQNRKARRKAARKKQH